MYCVVDRDRVAGNSETEPDEDDRALAARLESLRRQHGLSLEEVAIKAGISRATISRIERGETSPTASVLGKLCAAYGLTMSRLLAAIEEDAPRLIRRAEALVWRDPETGFERTTVSPPAKGYATELAWGELPAKADIRYDVPPVAGMEQHFLIFDGSLHVEIGGESYNLEQGDCLRLKLQGRSRVHNPGTTTARYLIVNSQPS